MATAPGIAVVFSDLESREYSFAPNTFNFSDTKSGTWSRELSTITWEGDNPSLTRSETGTDDVTRLDVRTGSAFSTPNVRIVRINHSPVSLSEGDTIIYTSIQISFGTDD